MEYLSSKIDTKSDPSVNRCDTPNVDGAEEGCQNCSTLDLEETSQRWKLLTQRVQSVEFRWMLRKRHPPKRLKGPG